MTFVVVRFSLEIVVHYQSVISCIIVMSGLCLHVYIIVVYDVTVTVRIFSPESSSTFSMQLDVYRINDCKWEN